MLVRGELTGDRADEDLMFYGPKTPIHNWRDQRSKVNHGYVR